MPFGKHERKLNTAMTVNAPVFEVNRDRDLVLIKGKDKTASVKSLRFSRSRSAVFVKCNNEKEYTYSITDVQYLECSRTVVLDKRFVLKDDIPLFGAACIQYFGECCRIIYLTGYKELICTSRIRIIESALAEPASKNCFDYLKEIASEIGLVIDEHNVLEHYYNTIDFVRNDSILAAFLNGKYTKESCEKEGVVIYPFGFNLSQKKAVDNALTNRISIIEGPPGTGKTQTILNIIANAVMRGKSVAVVSGNNTATANVHEKLGKYGLGFIAAPLGNSKNKDAFIEEQNCLLPDMKDWRTDSAVLDDIIQEEATLDKMLDLQNRYSRITEEYISLKKEYEHYKDYYVALDLDRNMLSFSTRINSEKILRFIAEYELFAYSGKRKSVFRRISLCFRYGLKNLRFCEYPEEKVISYCQNIYYVRRLGELEKRKHEYEKELSALDFDKKMQDYTMMSMAAFKATLAERYGDIPVRKYYHSDDLWKKSHEFIRDYPVVLSTTYSLRASLSNRFIYDYVIIDEASQVDLATGALALSCAKKTVIVGDTKQLPNVVDRQQKTATDHIFVKHALPEAYRYSNHSLLSSALELFPDAPRALLKEHYRCHPEIIGFCNQRFYNNELVVLTKANCDRQPLLVYKTVPGNHSRGHLNYRQIDVINDEVFPEQKLNSYDGSVGIVTPYRDQANELRKVFSETSVKADTVDKFQGQERSVMIFSTVDNEIGEFAADPNRLNVAVSRAINQFIVVTDGNDNDKTSPIHELIGYIHYHNHDIINSDIHSVFDCLYSGYAAAREAIMQKYGRVSDIESENLLYSVIKEILEENRFSKYGVVLHIPLRMILRDLKKLNARELSFATNHLTHVDFLIFSRLTHQPLLVVEVDGFSYHYNSEKQKERDSIKDAVLKKYGIPILRLSTVGSKEKQQLLQAFENLGSLDSGDIVT